MRSVPTASTVIGGWQVYLDRVSASAPGLLDPGCAMNPRTCTAVLDTGSAFVSVPTSVFKDILALTGATTATGPGVPTVYKQLPSCDLANLPTIFFHIGGKAFPLTPQQYTYKVKPKPSSPPMCGLR